MARRLTRKTASYHPTKLIVRPSAMPPRVLVLQGILPHYRIPFFDGLARRGYRLSVAHSGPPTQTRSSEFEEIRLPAFSFAGIHYQRRTTSLAREHDVVVIPMNPKSIGALLVSANIEKTHQIVWGHGLGRDPWMNRLRLGMAARASSVVLYDAVEIDDLVERGVPRRKIRVAPNTVDVSNAALDETIARDQFLYVGRLQERKGIEDLIGALALCERDLPSTIRVKVIGSGKHKNQLLAAVRQHGLEHRVHFAEGTTDEAFLKAEFQRSLAYVSPHHVGLGVLHSFAYGVPVITRAVARHAPEFHNVVNEVNGLLVGPTLNELGAAMTRLSVDDALSVRLGRRAFEHYTTNRTMNQMVSGMAEAIDQALAHLGASGFVPQENIAT